MHPHESLQLSSFFTNYLGPLKLLLQCCIVWLHMESVLEVVYSVLMATEHTLDITKKNPKFTDCVFNIKLSRLMHLKFLL